MTTTKNNEHNKLNFSSEREQSQACLNSAEHEKNQGRKVLNVPNKREQNQTCLDSAEREGLRPKGNVPNLRFKEFQGEWISKTIGDIAPLQRGFDLPTRQICNGKIPVVYSNGIMNHHSSYKCVAPGLVTGRSGTIGKFTYIEDGYYWPHNTSLWVTDFHDNNPKFIYYLYQTIHIEQYSTGSGVPTLNRNNVHRHKTFIPKLKEQNKIAAFLSLLDERISTQSKIIDKLQSLIKGLNDTLYAQHGDELLTSFAELGTSYSGLSDKSAQDFGSGKSFITYLNVYSNNVINENDFQYVTIKKGEKQNVVEYGDVLFTLSSETPEEVGIGSVYLGKEKVYLNSFCFGIHITNKEVAFPPYLSYYVSSTAFRKFIYPYAQGSTRFNLCKADFEKASIKLPTLENQKRIYSILSHIDSKIETEIQMLNLYNSQKQYLLRQMFI